MATPTYELIETTTLSSSASSVTFSSITQDYRDLVLVTNIFAIAGEITAFFMRFNSDSGNNYNRVYMYGNGTSTVSASETNVNRFGTQVVANDTDGADGYFQIMDYSATDKHKTALSRQTRRISTSDGEVYAVAYRWADTSAVTAIELFDLSGPEIAAGSTFSLYGIAS